jgi:hypothetical protein
MVILSINRYFYNILFDLILFKFYLKKYRYVYVCYSHLDLKIFSKINTIIYCCLTWIIAFIISCLFMYLDLFHFDEKIKTCLAKRTLNRYMIFFICIFCVILPFILIIICYIKIFIHTIEAKQRAITHQKFQKHKIDLKFSIGLFLSILLFVFTYVPFAIILMIDYNDTLPAAYHLYGLVLMRINSCLNPLLYGLTNTVFRKGFQNIYFLLFNRKQYSFSIEVKEKKLLNERILLQEFELKKLNTWKKEEEN